MGSSQPSPPQVYDPYSVANAQEGLNTQAFTSTAALQNMPQSNQFGSINYGITGYTSSGTPIYSEQTNLSPQQQGLLNTQVAGEQKQGNMGLNLLYNSAPMYSQPANLIGGANSLTGQMMGNELAALQPTFQEQGEQLNAQLTAEGLNAPGSLPGGPGQPGSGNQAYANAWNQLDAAQGQTMNQFLASAYPAAFSMAENQYMLPLQIAQSELSAVNPMSPTQAAVTPATATMQPADLESSIATAEQAQQAQYAAQMQQYSGMLQGIAGLGGAGMMALALA